MKQTVRCFKRAAAVQQAAVRRKRQRGFTVRKSVTMVVAMSAALGALLIAGCGGAGSPGTAQSAPGGTGLTPTGTVQVSAK